MFYFKLKLWITYILTYSNFMPTLYRLKIVSIFVNNHGTYITFVLHFRFNHFTYNPLFRFKNYRVLLAYLYNCYELIMIYFMQ